MSAMPVLAVSLLDIQFCSYSVRAHNFHKEVKMTIDKELMDIINSHKDSEFRRILRAHAGLPTEDHKREIQRLKRELRKAEIDLDSYNALFAEQYIKLHINVLMNRPEDIRYDENGISFIQEGTPSATHQNEQLNFLSYLNERAEEFVQDHIRDWDESYGS